MTIGEEKGQELGETPDRAIDSERRFQRSGVMASLFGMLAGLGMLVLLTAILTAGAILLELEFDLLSTGGDVQELSVIGLIIASVVVLISTFVGGFVAGRAARYGGMRVGLGSTLWLTLVLLIGTGVTLLLAEVSDAFEGFDLADRLSRFDTADLTIAGAIAAGGLFVLALLSGLIGGRLAATEKEAETLVETTEPVSDVRGVERETAVIDTENQETTESPASSQDVEKHEAEPSRNDGAPASD